jgi:LacI family transcriptional regulator
MADVAKLAGVSVTTVSFVINDRPDTGLRPETQDRVRAAVTKLGYRPNAQAQALARSATRTIGLIGEKLGTPYAGRIISGAHDLAKSRRQMLLILDAEQEEDFTQSVIDLQNRRVEGLVIATEGTRTIKLPLSLCVQPLVLVNCLIAGGHVPSLLPDEEQGGRSAARLLIDHGHRRLAYVAGDPNAWATRRRVKGFRAEVEAAGLDRRSVPVRYGDYRAESGYELVRELFRRGPRPTGLFMGNDRMALGAYFALIELGLRVPQDVSLVGYDDQEELADSMRPSLSTVRLPFRELGSMAAASLIDGTLKDLPRRTLVHCPLIVRNSVATAPAEVSTISTASTAHRG